MWLRAADSAQRGLRQPLPILLNALVTAGAVLTATGSVAAVVAASAVFVVTGLAIGLWRRRSCVQAQGVGWYMRRALPCATLSAAAVAVVPGQHVSAALEAGATAFVTLSGIQALLWLVVATARRRGLGLRRALVIGPERRVASTEYRIHLNPEAGLVCAHSHVTRAGRSPSPRRSRELIRRLAEDHSIEHLVCAGDDTLDTVVRDVIRLAPPELDVTVVTPVPLAGSPLNRLGDLAVACLGRPSWGTDLVKRAFDVAVSVLLLTALCPVLAVVCLAIRAGDPGSSVFRQARTGRHNRQFTIFKLRSMVDNAEELKPAVMDRNVADGRLFKAVDDPRVTRIGAFIRRFSIDELPQLLNVVRGEMSLVGPRPLPSVFDEDDLFARRRHEVLPGITGLWQVKGANALSYEDMLDLDCAYVATRSLGLDMRILLQTVPAVFVQRSLY